MNAPLTHALESQPKGAFFNSDRTHRYSLWRAWNPSKGIICFIGLNPSTANESKDDATIRRCVGFTQQWGYGGFFMLNLFTFVTPYPKDLVTVQHDVAWNNAFLLNAASECVKVIFAWGNFKEASERGKEVIRLIPNGYCLGVNRNGSPKHPLYLKKGAAPIRYSAASATFKVWKTAQV